MAGLTHSRECWAGTLLALDGPLTLILVAALRDVTPQRLFGHEGFEATSLGLELVVCAVIRDALYVFCYGMMGTASSVLMVSALSVLIITFKAVALLGFGDAGADAVLVIATQLLFVTAETAVICSLLRQRRLGHGCGELDHQLIVSPSVVAGCDLEDGNNIKSAAMLSSPLSKADDSMFGSPLSQVTASPQLRVSGGNDQAPLYTTVVPSDTEYNFAKAVENVEIAKHATSDDLLQLWALFKQAVEGPRAGTPAGMMPPDSPTEARWASLAEMDRQSAQCMYVSLVNSIMHDYDAAACYALSRLCELESDNAWRITSDKIDDCTISEKEDEPGLFKITVDVLGVQSSTLIQRYIERSDMHVVESRCVEQINPDMRVCYRHERFGSPWSDRESVYVECHCHDEWIQRLVATSVLHPEATQEARAVRMSVFRGLSVKNWADGAGVTATLIFSMDPKGYAPRRAALGPAQALVLLGAEIGRASLLHH